MKIGVVLEQELHSGGGFQQSLNAIEQLYRICPDWVEVEVFTTVEANRRHAALARRTPNYIPRSALEKVLTALLSRSATVFSGGIISRGGLITRLERQLIDKKIDLVYFLAPTSYATALRRLPYIFTVWDLCHRDHPEFPEVGSNGEFVRRENLYRFAINRSFLTITDSPELSARIQKRYGTDEERLLPMPFQVAPFINSLDDCDGCSIIERLSLPTDYLFYPAQFWAHKNHARIIQALSILKGQGYNYNAVFCGGDKGNKAYLERLAKDMGVNSQIYFIGFVAEVDMVRLYRGAKALVMPTYFGPTNIPPLEAWKLKKPVIYSSTLSRQADDATVGVNPDSAEELASAIRSVYEDGVRMDLLVTRGLEKLVALDELRRQSESSFIAKLGAFRNRRTCWGVM